MKEPESAEPLYARLAQIDPDDAETAATLDRLRRQLGKHEDIVEGLLERCEAEEDPTARALLWSQIGRLYMAELGDADQAMVAFIQAFCADPLTPAYAAEVERLAKSPDAWGDVLQECMEAAHGELPAPAKQSLLLQMARWYDGKISRPDLALPCYTAVLSTDASNDVALDGLSAIYSKAQQWSELGQTLLVRADLRSTPAAIARDLRVESAEILENRLGAADAAKELYEQVLKEDPGHARRPATPSFGCTRRPAIFRSTSPRSKRAQRRSRAKSDETRCSGSPKRRNST